MLMQNPAGDVYPPSKGFGPASPSTFPASAPVLPPENPREQCVVGYGTDPYDGKFCMIIQIHPQAIVKFSEGKMGSELPADVPNEIRNRVEKVIVRIGTGPVERIPPNASKLGEGRPTGEVRLTDLANRSPVTIDGPNLSNLLPVGGQNGNLQGASGNLLPNNMLPNNMLPNSNVPNSNVPNNNFTNNNFTNNGSNGNGSVHNDASVPPYSPSSPTHSNLNPDRNLPVSTFGGTGATGAAGGNAGMPNNFNTRNNDIEQYGIPAPSTSYGRDDFPSKSAPYNNPVKPNPTNPNSNYASNGYSANPGNYASGSNRPYTPIANNSNPTNATNGNAPNGNAPNAYDYPNSQSQSYLQPNNQIPPSLSATQQYGAPPLQQQSPYSTLNQYPIAPPTSMAGFTSTRANGNPTTGLEILPEDPSLAKDKLLPFLLLFSIVGNVYLGLWMNHLRGRYRQLLSNMRGIPVSDLG